MLRFAMYASLGQIRGAVEAIFDSLPLSRDLEVGPVGCGDFCQIRPNLGLIC